MRYSLLVLSLLFSFSTNVWATLTVIGVTGASYYTLPSTPAAPGQVATGSTIIYGGLAGGACTGDGSSTCSNCDQTHMQAQCPPTNAGDPALCACNEQRIYDGLRLHIDFNKDAADTGTPYVTITPTNTGTGTINNNQVPLIGSSDTYVELTWQNVCQYGFGSSCEAVAAGTGTTTIQATMTITLQTTVPTNPGTTPTPTTGASTTVTINLLKPTGTDYDVYDSTKDYGISSFRPYPGDEQVYITQIQHGTGWPSFNYGGTAYQLKVYHNTDNLNKAAPGIAGVGSSDLDIDQQSYDLDKSTVGGLTNGTRYYFRVAVKDLANNIVLFYPSQADADNAAGGGCTPTQTPAPALEQTCIFSTIPDQVLGLLTKDLNCFVATAAYGSSLEPKIQVFRDFRFQVLLQHSWGVWFVKKYYTYGPYAARFIADKPWLRSLSRAVLWPLYGFSLLCLHHGLLTALFVSLILLASLCVLPWYGFRRFSARA